MFIKIFVLKKLFMLKVCNAKNCIKTAMSAIQMVNVLIIKLAHQINTEH